MAVTTYGDISKRQADAFAERLSKKVNFKWQRRMIRQWIAKARAAEPRKSELMREMGMKIAGRKAVKIFHGKGKYHYQAPDGQILVYDKHEEEPIMACRFNSNMLLRAGHCTECMESHELGPCYLMQDRDIASFKLRGII